MLCRGLKTKVGPKQKPIAFSYLPVFLHLALLQGEIAPRTPPKGVQIVRPSLCGQLEPTSSSPRCCWVGDAEAQEDALIVAELKANLARGKTRRHETRRDETRQDKMTRRDKTRQDKARQGKTRQDKKRPDQTRQDKTRRDTLGLTIGAAAS